MVKHGDGSVSPSSQPPARDVPSVPGRRAASWWRDLACDNDHTTWDEIVECHDDLTKEDRERIITLGYYGKKVEPIHGIWLAKEKEWRSSTPYSVVGTGPEGAYTQDFENLDEAGKWIRERIQWCNIPDGRSFNTDYVNYHLIGFKLKDVNIDPSEWLP